jgi:anti-sigma-K factor RskA
MKLPNWRIVVGVAVLAVMIIKMGMWFVTRTPPIVIQSEPPGALVSIDDTFIGTTPLTLKEISRTEPHKVELTLRGRKVWSRTFLPGTLSENLHVTLEPVNPLQREAPTP